MRKRIIKLTEEDFSKALRDAQRQGREKLIQQIEALSEPKDGDRLVISGSKWAFLTKI